jgi:hypothetical protein
MWLKANKVNNLMMRLSARRADPRRGRSGRGGARGGGGRWGRDARSGVGLLDVRYIPLEYDDELSGAILAVAARGAVTDSILTGNAAYSPVTAAMTCM